MGQGFCALQLCQLSGQGLSRGFHYISACLFTAPLIIALLEYNPTDGLNIALPRNGNKAWKTHLSMCETRRFQDGSSTAKNPSILELQQARLIWPDTQVECLVSIGSGTVPVHKREKSMSAYVDTGNVLIESACSVDKVASALATTAPMIPGLSYYR